MLKDATAFRRTAAGIAMIAAAAGSVIFVALQPDLGGGSGERLGEIAANHGTATASALGFVVSQLFFFIAVLGMAHLVRTKAPILSNLGATFGVVGAFGHAVFGGAMLLTLEMAVEEADRAQMAALLDRFEGSVSMVFAAAGLLGTVLGTLLLAIALWRTRVMPRWIPAALVGFLVLEFAASSASRWASVAAGLLYLAALATLGFRVLAMTNEQWDETPARPEATAHALVRSA